MLRLPGISYVDRFISELGRRLPDEPVRVVGLPPGYKSADCLERIAGEVMREGTYPFEYPYEPESTVSSLSDLFTSITDILSLNSQDCASAEELVLDNIELLTRPATLGLVIDAAAPESAVRVILEACQNIAEFTKDIDGRLNFLLVVPYPSCARTGSSVFVWHPLTPQADTLVFENAFSNSGMTHSRLEQRGFEIYLGYRAFWEAAGAPEYIERLARVYDSRAFWISSEDADERIDEKFDALLADAGAEVGLLESLFEESMRDDSGRAVFSTAVTQPGPTLSTSELLSSGLAWAPPNSLHLRVTPVAAGKLVKSSAFREKWDLSQAKIAQFRAAARMSPILASWVMSLSGMVELEMLHFCKQASNLDDILACDDVKQSLEDLQVKTIARAHSPHRTELIDHASFGQLQHLIFNSELGDEFPLSRARVDEIRHTRNLVAHGHSVRWPSVRVLLQALATLYANEKRFRFGSASSHQHSGDMTTLEPAG